MSWIYRYRFAESLNLAKKVMTWHEQPIAGLALTYNQQDPSGSEMTDSGEYFLECMRVLDRM